MTVNAVNVLMGYLTEKTHSYLTEITVKVNSERIVFGMFGTRSL